VTKPLPASAPSLATIVARLRSVVLPELEAARQSIGRLPEAVSIRADINNLPTCARPQSDVAMVEVDRGDVLVLGAGLEAASTALDLLDAYDLDVGLKTLADGTPRTVLNARPNLLTLKSAASLGSARDHLDHVMAMLVQAIDAVRGETDNQSDDVLVIEASDREDADHARLILSLARQALSAEVTLPIDVVTGTVVLMDMGILEQERLNLSKFFSGQFSSLRPFLPPFDVAGSFESQHFPDPTFAGTAPDFTQNKIDNFLVGGPPCAACAADGDCNAFGLGELYCGYCGFNCTGAERRCSSGYEQCVDGMFY